MADNCLNRFTFDRDRGPRLFGARGFVRGAAGASIVCALWLSAAAVQGAGKAEPTDGGPNEDSPVVASVDGEPIYRNQLQAALAPMVEGRQLSLDELTQVQAETLALWIDRRLVEEALSADGKGVADKEIDAALAKLKTQLDAQHLSFEKFLAERHQTPDGLRRQIAWQMLWERTVERRLSDADLKAFFNEHAREFDGSEVRAAHILLRPGKAGDSQARPALLREAAALRDQIVAGKLTFAEAASKYSAGPSREKAGDVGFFPRHGIMAEPFAKAAFALKKGEISEPIATPFGIHLIEVTDIVPGRKQWSEVREELRPPAAQALFDSLAAEARAKAKIEYTGAWPYFKPGTHEVVTGRPDKPKRTTKEKPAPSTTEETDAD